MLVHSGEKPFRCTECKYACTRVNNLREHMFIHSGEKPFRCEQCNYSSAQAKSRKERMLTHSGEKPFSCIECTNSFTKAHERAHVHVTRKDWNITCYHTPARNPFSVSSATTSANSLGFWKGTWETTVERNATSLNLYANKLASSKLR